MLEVIMKGGIVMYFILLLSLIAMVIRESGCFTFATSGSMRIPLSAV